jgi:hypothetical protein
MTVLSFARLEFVPENLEIRATIYNVNVSHVGIVVDVAWAEEVKFPSGVRLEPQSIEAANLVNNLGQPQEALRERVQRFVKSNSNGGELLIEFNDPTYLTGFKIQAASNYQIDRIKICRMSLFIDVAVTVQSGPFSASNLVQYVLKNGIDNDQRFVMVRRGKDKPHVVARSGRTDDI